VLKRATWNVNSRKVRLPLVRDWLEGHRPDAGYQSTFSGQKTYNGVAVLSRQAAGEVITDVPGLDDPSRRILAVTVGDLRLVNLYVVNGQEVGSEKYVHKLSWLEHVAEWLAGEAARHPRLAVVGDFNIAPGDRDVHDPEAWHERILCSTPEREALGRILALGLSDAFRLFEQPERAFSWWDYRGGGFRRNLGLRIDLVLVSAALAEVCSGCRVDVEPRRLERPSDHAPVVAEFEL
jgi:exodeoxyribonuclease-3